MSAALFSRQPPAATAPSQPAGRPTPNGLVHPEVVEVTREPRIPTAAPGSLANSCLSKPTL